MLRQESSVGEDCYDFVIDQSTIQGSLAQVLSDEAHAIQLVAKHLPANAWRLVQRARAVTGKIVFSGMGKSGLIGKKLAATWSSLGIPAFFVHPSEALHGDLGAVSKNDLFIALSKSGTGEEFEFIMPILASSGISTALICCNIGPLTAKTDMAIVLPLEREACPFNLAPTSSSTVMMAFGDALALVISNLKNFNKHDFARNHPAGALGKKLTLTVRALMHPIQELPLIAPTTSFKDLLVTITSKKLGLCIVVDHYNILNGIVTDGDLRRGCEMGPAIFNKIAADLMTLNPKVIAPDTLAYVALEMMEDFNITSLVVVEGKQVVGLTHIHDLIKAGIRS